MTFTTPLGLLALIAIPVIVAIHMFRRRFPERRIAGLFLWQMARQAPQGAGRISRLPITVSLILECLAALALALILAGARLSPSAISAHLVVLLDDSASMGAIDARGESARDRGVRRVLAELDRLGSGARVTLVRSGERPSVLAGPAALALEARPALEAWKPDAPDHPLSLGIRLARELAGRTGRLMIVSDMVPSQRGEPEPEGALWAAVGEPLPNVAITGAERSLSPQDGRGAVSLRLANYSGTAESRRLDITASGTSVMSRQVDIPPGTSSIVLPVPAGLPPLRLALSGDPMLRDNEVTLAEPRPRIVGVENRLKDGRGRQALLKAVAAATGATTADPGHLVFMDAEGIDRAAAAGAWRVGFGRPPAAWLGGGAARDFIGPFVLEKRHPLLLGITLGGVVWTGALAIAPAALRPIASAGDQLLIGTTAAGDPAVLVNVDLDRTNLIRSPDWPIFISNLVEARRQALPGPERWNYRIGEWVRVRLGRDPKGPLRLRCGAVERTLPPGRELEFPAPAPGGLLQIVEGSDVLFELGVNFLDEREGDLRQQATADSGAFSDPAGLRAESGPASDPLFWILLACGGLALVGNWLLLSPRRAIA